MSSFTFTETLRLAVAGLADGARLRALEARPQVQIVALFDTDERRLAAARVDGAATHHRFAEVLAREDVDAVVIGTETARHYEMAAAALESGRHVFVAAPLAATPAEAERLVALAEARERRLMVGHGLRYHPAQEHAERLAAEGALGALHTVDAVWHVPALAPGAESVFDRLAPGPLAAIRALVPSAPVAVSAQARAVRGGGADVVAAAITHADGTLVTLRTSALAPRAARVLTAVGADATVVVDVEHGTVTVHTDAGLSVPRLALAAPARREAEAFVAALQERRAPRTDGAEGLAVVRLLDAVRRSAEAGGARVEL